MVKYTLNLKKMKNKCWSEKFFRSLMFLAISFIIVAFLVSLGGCMTTQKATDYLKKKGELAGLCADEYPVKDTVVLGDTITVTDTLETFDVLIDTVRSKDTVTITKTLPAKTIRVTSTIRDTVFRENTARVAQQAQVIDRLTVENNELIGKLSQAIESHDKDKARWRGKIGIPWWIFLLAIGIVFRKQLFRIAKTLITKI
jgi:hypothetical protein